MVKDSASDNYAGANDARPVADVLPWLERAVRPVWHHGFVGFSTQTEIRTFAALQHALAAHGYLISQKARVLDVIEAAATNPAATLTAGPSLGELVIPALREAAGPLGPHHPWLRTGDWDYAFKAHFDFVVHVPLGERHATHPLFAVEFDGPAHREPATTARDVRKNRLCLASGLPLVRVDATHLHERDGLSLIEWLAALWAAHRTEMPRLLAVRDAEVAAMDPGELDAAGSWLLGERPDLDVDLVFRLEHPYPPLRRLAERVSRRHGFAWSEVGAAPAEARWRVGRHLLPLPSLAGGLVETWRSELHLHGPAGAEVDVCGVVDVATGYPLVVSGAVEDSWEAIAAGGSRTCLPGRGSARPASSAKPCACTTPSARSTSCWPPGDEGDKRLGAGVGGVEADPVTAATASTAAEAESVAP